MRRAALVVLLLGLAAGCGGGKSVTPTHLRITALNPNVGMAIFHLDCAPAGGDVADPASACATLARDPALVTAPKPYTCIGGPWSWFDMTISGQLAGKPVHERFSTCWAHGMATLDKLDLFKDFNGHIRPPRRGVVPIGTPMTFPPRALRPGDFLVCARPYRHVKLGIPDTVGAMGSAGRLNGTRHADGSITARCA